MKLEVKIMLAASAAVALASGLSIGIVLFRFTKFWEKNIVIIREKWSVGIMINKEWLEPRLA